jgi:hypothetical protein
MRDDFVRGVARTPFSLAFLASLAAMNASRGPEHRDTHCDNSYTDTLAKSAYIQ